MDEWGILYGTVAHDDIVLIVAGLSANAVRHGRVPGRDFHFGLHFTRLSGTVRVETTDTRGERLPERLPVAPEGADAEEAGRGLLLVSHLAARWGWCPPAEGPGKTVWAEHAIRPANAPTGKGPSEGVAVE
ncbi:ATP-binding protein [Streptomyces griseofuscus]|nr:ATP-binding protein [Streptomyces griseofuscus]